MRKKKGHKYLKGPKINYSMIKHYDRCFFIKRYDQRRLKRFINYFRNKEVLYESYWFKTQKYVTLLYVTRVAFVKHLNCFSLIWHHIDKEGLKQQNFIFIEKDIWDNLHKIHSLKLYTDKTTNQWYAEIGDIGNCTLTSI